MAPKRSAAEGRDSADFEGLHDDLDDLDDDIPTPVGGVYSPWTARRTRPLLSEPDGDEPLPIPSSADFLVQPPPAGLTRRERRDHREREAQRIAQLWAAYPARRLRLPRRLGRRGRQTFRDVHRQNMATRRVQQLDAVHRERAAGALVVAVVIALVLLVRVVVFNGGGSESATTVSSSPAAPTTATTPASRADVTPVPATAADPAVVAVQTWFDAVCPSSPEQTTQARWDAVRGLMTEQAWASATAAMTDSSPISTWSCAPTAASRAADQPVDGVAIVNYSTDRTITPLSGSAPTVVEHIAGARVVIQGSNGAWLIDRIPESEH